MTKEIDAEVMRVASRQDHVFSRKDASSAGADEDYRSRRLKAREWLPVGAAAYRFAAAPLTWRGRLRAAVWDAGVNALISHDAAAQAYRFPGYTNNEVHVLVPKSLDHVCTIATVHESRRFELVNQRLMWNIPMVAPADTLVHIAPELSLKRLAWLTDELLLAKKVDLRMLNKAFSRLAPSCRGMKALRAVLHDHAPGAPVPESRLERRFIEFVDRYELPPPMRQVLIPGRQPWPSRVDFFWPDVRLIIEVDGRRWHARFQDFDRDHKRDLHFLAMGYPTARITWTMLTEDPDGVASDLRAIRSGTHLSVGIGEKQG